MIQIFGMKNCNDTKKAIRFFKDRKINVQFINLKEKEISKGELKSITKTFDIEELLDREGKEFKKRNLEYYVFDTLELLMESPELFKTPILREKDRVSLGYQPEIWKEWIK
ncbi:MULTISPECIES: arsenate reductase family protein [Psychrilyobacter]|uniref:ArsC family transcriptional regulator n=1 Tax=Psychrilyobacter piezotolerans TaxID=2293438 RepID=A0ABX9KGB0_9FUSO|nr:MULTISPECIES: arsenate reductase family protein [Psychrilyobacter]MCS5422959.1 arsenate reductase family protein [Psychrilyobacter sp. S5]NDI77711.1 ArsC family transcriptional regulator [Psychrilyobacter piezotolerans]RDE61411.1 ArsC family transcriptional regulator [Psychrilyobacter sp. S5]REI40932.1 ArsC family transcriptional regulator [Psychrilyobacter piezotolerans]